MDSGTRAAGANKSGSDSDSEVKFKDDELDNDSERSLDEDEALHGHDSEEIDSLQKESELPLEVLLLRYGYGPAAGSDEEPARASSSSAVRRKRVKRDVTSSTTSTKRPKTEVSEPEAVGAVSTSNDDHAAETSKQRDTAASAPEVDAGAGAESDSLDGEEFTSDSDSESDSEAEGEEDERYDVVGLLNDEPIEDEEGEDGIEYDPDADQSNIPYWKRDVRVGEEFQATLPDCSTAERPEASSKSEELVTTSISASESESAKADRLDFRPKPVEESSIERYLVSFYKLLRRRRALDEAGAAGGCNGDGAVSKQADETGDVAFERCAATKDDEHALRTLFNCEFDVDRALRLLELELFPSDASSNREACASVSTSTGEKPSEPVFERGDETFFFDAEECARFEAGLRYFGKDFFQIRRVYFSNEAKSGSTKDEEQPSAGSDSSTSAQLAESHETGDGSGTGDQASEKRADGCIRCRSVRELVRFYYVWKKTERRDAFVQRYPFDKKRYVSVRPGVSDYLDRLFDEEPHEADADADVDTGAHSQLAEAPVETEQRQHAGANGVSNSQHSEESQRRVTSENLAD